MESVRPKTVDRSVNCNLYNQSIVIKPRKIIKLKEPQRPQINRAALSRAIKSAIMTQRFGEVEGQSTKNIRKYTGSPTIYDPFVKRIDEGNKAGFNKRKLYIPQIKKVYTRPNTRHVVLIKQKQAEHANVLRLNDKCELGKEREIHSKSQLNKNRLVSKKHLIHLRTRMLTPEPIATPTICSTSGLEKHKPIKLESSSTKLNKGDDKKKTPMIKMHFSKEIRPGSIKIRKDPLTNFTLSELFSSFIKPTSNAIKKHAKIHYKSPYLLKASTNTFFRSSPELCKSDEFANYGELLKVIKENPGQQKNNENNKSVQKQINHLKSLDQKLKVLLQ